MTDQPQTSPSDQQHNKSLREILDPEQVQKLHDRLDQALDSHQQAFVVIMNSETQNIADTYLNVCERCVHEFMHFAIHHALQEGYLTAEAVAKMQGHTHQNPPQPPKPDRPGLEL